MSDVPPSGHLTEFAARSADVDGTILGLGLLGLFFGLLILLATELRDERRNGGR